MNVLSNFQPEYGRNAGAVVNIVTKSGSNKFHGRAVEYFRNNALDARNYFNPSRPAPGPFPQQPVRCVRWAARSSKIRRSSIWIMKASARTGGSRDLSPVYRPAPRPTDRLAAQRCQQSRHRKPCSATAIPGPRQIYQKALPINTVSRRPQRFSDYPLVQSV